MFSYEHIILDTDYENYAITYGCDNYFGLFHGRWASFLTRIEYAEVEYVEIAKKWMRDIEYDYNFWWVQTGEACGWEAAPTSELTMINVFETEPNWNAYTPSARGTQKSQDLWKTISNLPTGPITGPLSYNSRSIETPLKTHILSSDYQDFIYLNRIGFTAKDLGDIYVDIWLLSEGLPQEDLGKFKQIKRTVPTPENPLCCWEYQNGAPFFIRSMVSGYARVIIYHRTKGIYGFYEGHFSKGNQLDFGRSLNFFPVAKWYYFEQIYVGWLPNAEQAGQGIAIVDNKYINEGTWGIAPNFPNDGEDFINPPASFVAHTITDFKFRLPKE